MRIKKDFVLREIAGTWVVLPLAAETVNFNGMMNLNDSGVLLWKALEENCNIEELTNVLVSEFEVSVEQAKEDAQAFVSKLMEFGCIEE